MSAHLIVTSNEVGDHNGDPKNEEKDTEESDYRLTFGDVTGAANGRDGDWDADTQSYKETYENRAHRVHRRQSACHVG